MDICLNPDVEVRPYPFCLEDDNAGEIFAAYDFIVDGSDNFPTKFLVNDVAIKKKRPTGMLPGFLLDKYRGFDIGRGSWTAPFRHIPFC